MKRTVVIVGLFSCLLAGALLILAGARETAASASRAGFTDKGTTVRVANSDSPDDCGYIWHVVASPNSGTSDNHLQGMAAITPSDIWAVGYFYNGNIQNTLVEHWNGTSWTVVPSPNSGTGDNELYSVTAVSDTDIWAVGYAVVVNNVKHTLAEHWNGSSWSIVSTAGPGTYDNILESVAAVSSGNVWAVGYQTDSGHFKRTLIEHWTGSSWTVATSPNVGTNYNVLQSVAAVGGNDIWAAGYYIENALLRTLIIHWNGTIWSVVTSANSGNSNNILNSISAGANNDIWAVGTYYYDGALHRTLVEHWNGVTWVLTPSPNAGAGDNTLTGVSVYGSNDAWAVGYYEDANTDHTLTLHWDSSAWTTVPSANLGTSMNQLEDVAILDSGNVWAIGEYLNGNFSQTLIERYSLTCYTPTPTTIPSATPTVTGTPPTNTPTSTRTPTRTPTSTSTPGAEPTSCPLQFSDVPQGSTFYSFVRCMACRGIVNGYTSGCESGNPCFRPNNKVTRGQLAKIVANSAGLSDPGPVQLFQDVAPGSTFYNYVQALANAGMIGGYPCGGAGEPCGPGNLPYFRPNANATRGQITKIVSNAAGFNDNPSGQQFQDVGAGSTYYTFAYRLVTRSIMAGYPCGDTGEPCVPPANLPYFRPNNNATRGQTSKIVSNTFFPNCQTP